jgi:hypothetical protein
MSYAEAIQEPWAEVVRMLTKWSLDAERDKLEAERQKFQNRSR